MKNIKINYFTWYFLLISFLCGFIKQALIILGIVLFHELGHIFFIKLFSYKVINVTIYPFGGVTKIEKDLNTPVNKELLIAFGGIIFQIILYLILLFNISETTKDIIFKYNSAILLFNLLPIIPLDGSIILNSFLNKFFSYKKSYIIYFLISILGIILYLIFNYWYSLNNYMIVMLFIYKTYEALKNYNYLYNRFLLERFIHNYKFKYISTKEGNLDILKKDTYQYFKENDNIVSEKKILARRFDKRP